MNPTGPDPVSSTPDAAPAASPLTSPVLLDDDEGDPRVAAALKEYQAALDSGSRPDRQAFLRDHSDIGPELAEALDALDFVSAARASLRPPAPPRDTHLPPVAAGATLGDFQITRELGRGGMGIVYEAIQKPLGRRVALKILPLQVASSARHLERFQREAQAAARLHHTNIVPVFGVGEHRGIPFYAMQFIAGRPLDAVLRALRGQSEPNLTTTVVNAGPRTPPGRGRGSVPVDVSTPDPVNTLPAPETALERAHGRPRDYFREVARAGAQVAAALHYAHGQGVLHRDVKPSNLLMDRQGTVWITDFGLAKLEGPEALTQTGDVLGTLRYLAPERLQGQADASGDVYSLGLTLYELLTLTPAFAEEDPTLLMRRIAEEEPPPPRRHAAGLPRDLETVILKAIAKEPAARYATAGEFAEDLERFLADRPVQARREGWLGRLLRWCRRNPALALFVGLFVAALLGAAGVAGAFAVSKDRDARELERHADDLDKKNQELKDSIETLRREQARRREALTVAARLAQDRGRALCDRGDLAEGLLWLAGSLTLAPQDAAELQRFGRREVAAWSAHHAPMRLRLSHPKPVMTLAVSGDGKRLLAGSLDGEAFLWDAATGRPVGEVLRHRFQVGTTSFSADGRRALTSGGDGLVFLWDAATGKALGEPIRHGEQAARAAFTADGKRVVTSGAGMVRFWTVDGKPLGKEIRYSGEALALAVAPDGKTAVVGSSDRTARLWDLETGKPLGPPMPHNNWVTGVIYEGTLLATVSADQQIRLWNPANGLLLKRPGMHSGRINALAVSPDRKVLATASEDRTVRLWSAETGAPLGQPLQHRAGVKALAFSPDSTMLASGGGDTLDERGEARVWSVATGAAVGMPLPSLGPVNALRFTPDGRSLYVAGGRMLPAAGEVRLWDVPGAGGSAPALRHEKQIVVILFSPDGKMVLTGSYDGTARLWDAATGKPLTDPLPHGEGVTVAEFSTDGKWFVAGGGKAGVRVYETATGKPRGDALGASDDGVTLARFSPDGRHLALGTGSGEFRVWEWETRKAAGPAVSLEGSARAASFSASGKLLLVMGRSSARGVEVASGQWVGPPASLGGELAAACLSADGRRATLASGRGVVVRYAVADGLAGQGEAGEGSGGPVSMTPDGRGVLVAGPLREARLLDGATGQPLGPPWRTDALHVHYAALSADGRTAATAGGMTVQLWDAATGRQIGPTLPQPRRATLVALSRDGTRLAATSEDGTARLYALPEFAGDAERLVLWAQVRTGMELDGGRLRVLSADEVAARRERLGRLPGPALP